MAQKSKRALREQLAGRGSMAFVAANVQLKAKLLTKGKLRPHDMVRKKLPDGAGLLEELPRRARSGADEGDEAADAAYCAAIDKVSRVTACVRQAAARAEHGRRAQDVHAPPRRLVRARGLWLLRGGGGRRRAVRRGARTAARRTGHGGATTAPRRCSSRRCSSATCSRCPSARRVRRRAGTRPIWRRGRRPRWRVHAAHA